jgi:hypothetical protein
MKSLKFIMIPGLMFLMASCYYDEPPPPAEIDPELVSFSGHIVPIFDKACNNPGCHSSVEGDPVPDLTAENAYDQLLGGGYVNLTIPESSILYLRIIGTSAGPLMPPGSKLTSTDIELVLAWINKGALND